MRCNRYALLALTLVSALAPGGPSFSRTSEPERIHVGDAVMDGSTLKPYTNLWKVSVVGPNGHSVTAGAWTDQLKSVELDGRKLMERIQLASYSQGGQANYTANTFDPKTMAPVVMDWKTLGGSFHHREFNGATVKFRSSPQEAGGKEEQGSARFDAPVFDFYGGMYGLLLVPLPLHKGYQVTFPSIDETTETQSWVTARVTGKESVNAGPGKTVDAWKVECDTYMGPMTFWLTKEPPYIIKLYYVAKKNGYQWTYEMV